MKKKRTPELLPILALFTVVLVVWLGVAGAFVSQAAAKGVYQVVVDWQPTLAAGVALSAAYVAARPVWKQLQVQSLQTSIAMHGTLTTRAGRMEQRSKEFIAPVRKTIEEMLRALNYGIPPANFSHWAWDGESLVDDEITALTRQQEEFFDGPETTITRRVLINRLMSVRNCLSDINCEVHRSYASDTLGDVSSEEEAQLRQTAQRAEDQLPKLMQDAYDAFDEWAEGFDEDLTDIRSKLRVIDHMMLRYEITARG